MIDAVADHLVTSARHRHLHGPVPFTGAGYLHDTSRITAVQRWIDDVDGADETAPQQPRLLLAVKPPKADTTVLEAILKLCWLPGDTGDAVNAEEVWWEGMGMT